MDSYDFPTTSHALRRKQQRCVTDTQIGLVLDWGRSWRQESGRDVRFVGRREVRLAARSGLDIRLARNVAAVVADDGTIITVIKSSDLRRLRRAGFKQWRSDSQQGGCS